MKIGFHDFETGKARGGALFFYSEAARLLSGLSSGAHPCPHDVYWLMGQPEAELKSWVQSFSEHDVVVSNVGPYAHLYHYLRERYDGRFRIVRDVRTSAWAGFFLQENLAGPLTREGDLVLFPSQFCREFFCRQFPRWLNAANTAVCYPLSTSFPQILPEQQRDDAGMNIGYIGRIADDKNFDQVVEIFVRLNAQAGERVNLHLAGHIDPLSRFGSIRALRRHLKKRGVPADRLIYYGHLPYREIWGFFRRLDVFVFPAVASVESLGRVLLEAQHCGVPVVAAHYAAASEILPAENLIKPVFDTTKAHRTIEAFSLGRVDEDSMIEAIAGARVGDPKGQARRYHPQTYLDLVLGYSEAPPVDAVSGFTRAYIDDVQLQGLWPQLDAEEAMSRCRSLLQGWRGYNDNTLARRLNGMSSALFAGTTYPRRLGLYAQRLIQPQQRFELGNAREHCWMAGFDPYLNLDEQPQSSESNWGEIIGGESARQVSTSSRRSS